MFGQIALDYKFVLNVVAFAVFAALFALTVRRGVTDPVCLLLLLHRLPTELPSRPRSLRHDLTMAAIAATRSDLERRA